MNFILNVYQSSKWRLHTDFLKKKDFIMKIVTLWFFAGVNKSKKWPWSLEIPFIDWLIDWIHSVLRLIQFKFRLKCHLHVIISSESYLIFWTVMSC